MIPARRLPLPPIPLTLAVSAALLWTIAPLGTFDMREFLLPWLDHIIATGPVAAFATPFSNYTPAYLYLLALAAPLHAILPEMLVVKGVSLVGTGALWIAVRHLLIRAEAPQPDRAAALVVLLPTVALNAGLLGQCDAIWAAACVMALAAALDRRHAAMLVWCGLALGFKLQPVLIAPFFLALLINRRVSFRLWPIAPLTATATLLPALAAGWPAGDLATIWLRQADTFTALSMNAPNLWIVVQRIPWIGGLSLIGLAMTAALGTSAAYIAWFSARPLHGRALIEAALLCPLVTAGLLPRMHERYFFLADVLALALALVCRDRAHWRTAILVQTGSLLALFGCLSGVESDAMFGAVAMLAATWQHARRLLRPAANDNPLMARTA